MKTMINTRGAKPYLSFLAVLGIAPSLALTAAFAGDAGMGEAVSKAPVAGAVAEEDVSLWDARAGLGFSLTRGNSDTLLLNADFLAERAWDMNELRLGGDLTYGETEGEKTASRYHGFAQYNRLISDRMYLGLVGDFLNDDLADLDYRVAVIPTLGYYLIKNDRTTLALEAGAGYSWEDQAGLSRDYWSLRLAERFTHQLNDRTSIWQMVEYLPELEEFGNYILNAEVGISTRLTDRLSINLVGRNRYDSDVPAGIDKNDLSVISSLSYALGEVAELAPVTKGGSAKAADDWNTTAQVGFSLNKGNSDNLTLSGDVATFRETAKHILTLAVGGAYGEVEDATTLENVYASADLKHKFANDRTYGSLFTGFLYDDVAAIDHRVTVAASLGHFFIKNDTTTFNVEAGPGYIFEKVGGVKDDYLTVRVAQGFSHQLNDTMRVWESVEYLPELEDFDNYIINAAVGLETQLAGNLSLNTYLRNSYDNRPAPGVDSNDLSLITAIAVTF